ncbi:MAG: hypothetical protein M3125_08560 [Gemmatimonadota bacterium]|nr:hypothetical protein [Gemmatimonadota bacterium]
MTTPHSDELTPALTAAEEELIARVEEACALGPEAPGEEDTGELLRLEHALEAAARAAEKAIELRTQQRRLREGKDYTCGMREFRDHEGHEWRLWAVKPLRRETPTGSLDRLRPEYQQGWLSFERLDGVERRRLLTIPEDWATRSVSDLEHLLSAATAVPPRTPKPGDEDSSECPDIEQP